MKIVFRKIFFFFQVRLQADFLRSPKHAREEVSQYIKDSRIQAHWFTNKHCLTDMTHGESSFFDSCINIGTCIIYAFNFVVECSTLVKELTIFFHREQNFKLLIYTEIWNHHNVFSFLWSQCIIFLKNHSRTNIFISQLFLN